MLPVRLFKTPNGAARNGVVLESVACFFSYFLEILLREKFLKTPISRSSPCHLKQQKILTNIYTLFKIKPVSPTGIEGVFINAINERYKHLNEDSSVKNIKIIFVCLRKRIRIRRYSPGIKF